MEFWEVGFSREWHRAGFGHSKLRVAALHISQGLCVRHGECGPVSLPSLRMFSVGSGPICCHVPLG